MKLQPSPDIVHKVQTYSPVFFSSLGCLWSAGQGAGLDAVLEDTRNVLNVARTAVAAAPLPGLSIPFTILIEVLERVQVLWTYVAFL